MGAKEIIGMVGDIAGAATGVGGVFNMIEYHIVTGKQIGRAHV